MLSIPSDTESAPKQVNIILITGHLIVDGLNLFGKTSWQW